MIRAVAFCVLVFLIRITYLPVVFPIAVVLTALSLIIHLLRELTEGLVDPILCIRLLLDKEYKYHRHLFRLCSEKEGWWKRLFQAAGRIKI